MLSCRACSAGRLDSARALVEGAKAKLEVKDASGATPLGVAASCGDQTITLYLLSKGADPEVCTSCLYTLAMMSCAAYQTCRRVAPRLACVAYNVFAACVTFKRVRSRMQALESAPSGMHAI